MKFARALSVVEKGEPAGNGWWAQRGRGGVFVGGRCGMALLLRQGTMRQGNVMVGKLRSLPMAG